MVVDGPCGRIPLFGPNATDRLTTPIPHLAKKRMPRIAIVIATRDEAIHIERAIASTQALGPVFVVDAGSTDGTGKLARRLGATVLEHAWEGYAAQKDWARAQLPDEFAWVLHLDADEYLTPILRDEIRQAVEKAEHPGFYLPRQNIFLSRVLRNAWWYPDYQLRLFRRDAGEYEERHVHEHVLLDGEAGFLDNPLMHDNRKSIDAFIDRHQKYASLEAAEIAAHKATNDTRRQRKGSLFGSWPERRRALKTRVWYRLPGRPIIRFLWMYLVRRGFKDGRQGLIYCQLIAAYEAMIDAKLAEHAVSGAGPVVERGGRLRDRLVCPECRGAFRWHDSHCVCAEGHRFPVVEGIPIFLRGTESSGEQAGGDAHKARQAGFFDGGDGAPQFEETRPAGTPNLYKWMLERKFSRAIDRIEHLIPGATAVVVCGGSGMDAEFLARAGAKVITTDISFGAARRASIRARRLSLPILSVVADAEHLPLDDDSVDIAYVHDGLHHLVDPELAVCEMSRVASCAVSITEPAVAAVTALAVRAGFALDREEAGNRVMRIRVPQISASLSRAGFRILKARRYGMFYRHTPGRPTRIFSKPGLFAITRLVWFSAAVPPLSRFGNKLTIQAEVAEPRPDARGVDLMAEHGRK